MGDYGMPIRNYENIPKFVIKMLKGDETYGINFDRLIWHSGIKRYIIIEYLLCDERQFDRGVTPFSSHPRRYFSKNAMKFISLWKYAELLEGRLYLVNYSKKGTRYEDEVLLLEVESVDPSIYPYVVTKDTKMTRLEFSKWLRELNSKGQ